MSTIETDLNLPHGSIWPAVLALGFGAVGIGLLLGGVWLAVGLLVFAAAGVGWVHEDLIFYDDHVSTGERNGWYATILFLCTEVMIFGGLFATYFNAQARFDVWPPEGTVELPVLKTGINTIILLLSGVTMHWAHVALRKGDKRKFNLGLIGTLVLGTIFLGGQVLEYQELIHEGLTLQSAPFGSSFYMLTGTHGLHVFAGLVFIGIVLFRSLKGQFTAERHMAVEAAAIYWHFVDVVWVVLYAVVYLLA